MSEKTRGFSFIHFIQCLKAGWCGYKVNGCLTMLNLRNSTVRRNSFEFYGEMSFAQRVAWVGYNPTRSMVVQPPLTSQLSGVTPLFNLPEVRAVRQGTFIPLVSKSWCTPLTHSHSFHLTEVGGRSPPVHLVLGHVPLRPTEVGGTVGGLPPRWRVVSLPLPHLALEAL